MSGAAAAATPAPTPGATPTPAATPAPSPTPDWTSGFKEDVRGYITQKGFKSPEALAESYKHLEARFSTPPDKTLVLPEKLEGDNVRPIFERLGAPKEAKGYELPREQGADATFIDFLEGSFAKNFVTKSQAQGLYNAIKERASSIKQAQDLAARQGEEALKQEWGAKYEENVNIASQGKRILGLDDKTLAQLEAAQGKQTFYKTLHKIGVAVGESTFVDGNTPNVTEETPEVAQEKIKALMGDQKFLKKINKGDVEARKEWDRLNRLAAPGELQVR